MARFAYVFHAGETSGIDPQESMQNWMRWVGGLGERRREGAPLGGGRVMGTPDDSREFEWSSGAVTGYMVVETADIDEASRLARDCPAFGEGGHVEVREIMEM